VNEFDLKHRAIHSYLRFWIRKIRQKSSLALARSEASLMILGFCDRQNQSNSMSSSQLQNQVMNRKK